MRLTSNMVKMITTTAALSIGLTHFYLGVSSFVLMFVLILMVVLIGVVIKK